jgi:hypothetical protein
MQLLSENGQPTIMLTAAESITLELKLNVTSKGKIWSHIGDILFEFGSGKKNAANSILLTIDQYDFIEVLMSRATWESCRDL